MSNNILFIINCSVYVDMSTHTDDVEIGSGEAPSSVELMRARLRPRGRRGQQLVPVVQKLRPGRGRGVARGMASGGGDGEGAESRKSHFWFSSLRRLKCTSIIEKGLKVCPLWRSFLPLCPSFCVHYLEVPLYIDNG